MARGVGFHRKLLETLFLFAAGLLLVTLAPVAAQPRLSLQVQHLDFKGNLLRLADGGLLRRSPITSPSRSR